MGKDQSMWIYDYIDHMDENCYIYDYIDLYIYIYTLIHITMMYPHVCFSNR